VPFGAGPKVCLGLAFAVIEAQIIPATLLARFQFGPPRGFVLDPRM